MAPTNQADREDNEGNKFGGTTPDKVYVRVSQFNSLVTENYDFVDVDYTDGLATSIVFKTGGSGGTTVATLTITYTDGCMNTVTKT